MKRNILSLAASLAVIALACSKSSSDTVTTPPPSPGGCDTVNMKYIANVVPILQSHCYECHGTNTSAGSGGIVLQGYDELKSKADNGQLVGVITHAAGFPAMPSNKPKLSDCDINIIKSWINNGAQNN